MALKQERKTDRSQTLSDIILKAVRAVKTYLSDKQQQKCPTNISYTISLKFNMNYCTLSHYRKKT